MRFNQIVAQSDISHYLMAAVANDRLSPTILFEGHEGCGALQLAIALSQFLFCDLALNNDQQGDALTIEEKSKLGSCGKCASCQLVQKGMHPDLHYFYPVVVNPKAGETPEKRFSSDYATLWHSFLDRFPYGNASDWQSYMGDSDRPLNITAQECKQILQVLQMKPYQSKYKVCIVWLPEFLGKESNRLLKVVEEPTPHTYIFFVTEQSNAMLHTMRSRCLSVQVPLSSDSKINRYMQSFTAQSYNKQHIEDAVLFARGNLRHLHQWIDKQHIQEEKQQAIKDMFETIVHKGPMAQLSWIETQSKLGKTYIRQLLTSLIAYMRDYVTVYVGSHSTSDDYNSSTKELFMLFQNIGVFSNSPLLYDAVEETLYAIRRNSNTKLELHAMLINIYHTLKSGKYFFPLFD